MQVFLSKLVLFGIIYASINLLAYKYVAFPVIYKEYHNHEPDTINQFNKILLSDSHGWRINDHYLEKIGIYNFSYGSDSYYDMLCKLYFIGTHCPNTDTVLLSADNHTLSEYRQNMNNTDQSIHYLSLMNIPHALPYNPWEIWYKCLKYYFPLTNTSNSKLFYYYTLSKAGIPLPKDVNINNDDTRSKTAWHKYDRNKRVKLAQKRVKQQFPVPEKSIKLQRALKAIIRYARKQDITLIGIKFPLSKAYLQAMNKDYEADKILQNNNIPTINLQKAFPEKTKYFSNQDHINNKGSKIFCQKLHKNLLGL